MWQHRRLRHSLISRCMQDLVRPLIYKAETLATVQYCGYCQKEAGERVFANRGLLVERERERRCCRHHGVRYERRGEGSAADE